MREMHRKKRARVSVGTCCEYVDVVVGYQCRQRDVAKRSWTVECRPIKTCGRGLNDKLNLNRK